MPLKDAKDTQLIPLCKFARSGQYTQQYLSLLVQRKKLRARRIGRNYYTTKEWFADYLVKHSRKDLVESSRQNKVSYKLTKAKKRATSKLMGFSFFVGQKLTRAKTHAAKKVELKPWVGRLVIFAWFVLVLSIYLVRYSPNLSARIMALADLAFLSPGKKIVELYQKYQPAKYIGSYDIRIEKVDARK